MVLQLSKVIDPMMGQLKNVNGNNKWCWSNGRHGPRTGHYPPKWTQLQTTETRTKAKIMDFEFQLQCNNLWLRGFAGVKGNTELPIFIASWLTAALQLEYSVTPITEYAYGAEPSRKSVQKSPRDILVWFLHYRIKEKTLGMARSQGYIPCKDKKT